MNTRLPLMALAAVLAAWTGSTVAGDAPAVTSPVPPQMIALKVGVDAAGNVTSAKPWDPQANRSLNAIGEAFARKLVFVPARKNGKPAPSETSLTVVFTLEPAGEGRFAPKLKRAVNGPGVVHVGKVDLPNLPVRRIGALVVVAVNVNAEGVPDPSTQATERVQLREPNKFAEARYLDAVSISVRGSRFEVDKVDGAAVPSRVSLPYQFGSGPAQPNYGEDKGNRGAKPPTMDIGAMPVMTAVSSVPGIELPRLDYRSPDLAAAPVK